MKAPYDTLLMLVVLLSFQLYNGLSCLGKDPPPVCTAVAVDVTSSRAAWGRTLEDVFMHGQDCRQESHHHHQYKPSDESGYPRLTVHSV